MKFVSQPRPEEVAKFRTSSNADFAVLVGEFTSRTDFLQEIQLHAISVWTVADIITALRNDVDAYECRALFAPGFVTERLADLVWSRSHGEEKRELVVREILRREGYAAQCTLIGEVTPADAPVLSLDAAMLLVDSARIVRLRIARGDSVYELATAAGVLACTIQRLESGKPARQAGLAGAGKSTRRACLPTRVRRAQLLRTSMRAGTVAHATAAALLIVLKPVNSAAVTAGPLIVSRCEVNKTYQTRSCTASTVRIQPERGNRANCSAIRGIPATAAWSSRARSRANREEFVEDAGDQRRESRR